MKKLLLIYTPYRTFPGSLHEMVVEALKSTGLEVDYLDIENLPVFKNDYWPDKIRNIFERKFRNNKLYSVIAENTFHNRFFLKQLIEHQRTGKKYDYVLIIKPEEYSPEFIKIATSLGNKTAGYIWDGLRLFFKPNILKSRKYLDNLYSFDISNIQEHPDLEMKFCPNFAVFNQEVIPYEQRKTDLFYVGDLAGKLESQRRDLKLSHFLQKITGNFDVNIWWSDSIRGISKLQEINFKYINNFISLSESLNRTRNSKIVIDICKGHHIGLSFRFFECLAAETKVITNNRDVVNYDFYNPENIMVVDFEQDILEENVFEEFIQTPYKTISSEILDKYSIGNWMKYIFQSGDYKNYQHKLLPIYNA